MKAKHSTRKPVKQPEVEFAGTPHEIALSNLADVEALKFREVDRHEQALRDDPAWKALVTWTVATLKRSSSNAEFERQLRRFGAKCFAAGRLSHSELEASTAELLVEKDVVEKDDGRLEWGGHLKELFRA
jgi:hypothetical protein